MTRHVLMLIAENYNDDIDVAVSSAVSVACQGALKSYPTIRLLKGSPISLRCEFDAGEIPDKRAFWSTLDTQLADATLGEVRVDYDHQQLWPPPEFARDTWGRQ